MAITNFQRTIWSTRLNESLKKNLVYGSVVNTDYEGEIKEKGQTVKILSVGGVTISDYDKATGMNTPEEVTDSSLELTINQAKSFNFRVDDIDKAQTNANIMDAAMKEAAYGLADKADQYIAGLYTGVAAGNVIGDDTTPVVPTSSNAYDYLVDLGVILDEANVPDMDRFVIVPAWVYGLLLKDARFTKDAQVMASGYIGQVNNMRVFKSNNVPNTTGTKYKIMAGYKGAISFANAIVETEAYRPEKFFADAVKGLHLYGAKLVKSSGIAIMTANKS